MINETHKSLQFNQSNINWFVLLILLVIIGVIIFRTAWVCDDAFITFRVIENFWQGYGLRWNIEERVWVYTHPLWLFLLALLYPLTKDLYLITILLGSTLTLIAVYILLRKARLIIIFLSVGCLLSSAAFIDYATSGLENSLGFLLIILFISHIYESSGGKNNWYFLSLLTSLGILTRPDLGALFGPILLLLFITEHPPKDKILRIILQIILGLSPLVAWEIFTLIYYGALIPNTALAKLNHGISLKELLPHGLAYGLDTLLNDPITLLIIAFAFLAGFFYSHYCGYCQTQSAIIMLGILIYLLYIIMIGGDYMRGRFFAIPFIAAQAVINFNLNLKDIGNYTLLPIIIIIWGNAIFFAIPFNSGADFTSLNINNQGIANERGFYFQYTGFINQGSHTWQDHIWAKAGSSLSNDQKIARCQIGMFGYAAPNSTYIIDPLALAEPFFARLPAKRPFRIGHFERNFPKGYLESQVYSENHLHDPILRNLYNDIFLVTRGALWSTERLSAIIRLNFRKNSLQSKIIDFDPNATGEGIIEKPERNIFTCMGIPGELQSELRLESRKQYPFNKQL